jgi:hypothetical protein
MMRKIAASYEKLAQRLEENAGCIETSSRHTAFSLSRAPTGGAKPGERVRVSSGANGAAPGDSRRGEVPTSQGLRPLISRTPDVLQPGS